MLGAELGYAQVSTAKQDLDRQIDALSAAGIPAERIYLDKKSGATTDRPGLRVLLDYARSVDVIVVHTRPAGPHRAGHPQPDPRPRRARCRGPQPSRPDGPARRRAARPVRADGTDLHPRAGRPRPRRRDRHGPPGRPAGHVDPAQLDYAAHLRAAGHTVAEIVTKTGILRTSLYRHLPPRPPEPVTAGEVPAARR